jgi:hypothetical protein
MVLCTFLRAVVICIWHYFHRLERHAGPIKCRNTRVKQMVMVVVYVSLGGGSDSDWDDNHLLALAVLFMTMIGDEWLFALKQRSLRKKRRRSLP